MTDLGFIFDLDGTIIDTTAYYREIWEGFIREFESDYSADTLLGHSARDGFRKMLGADLSDEDLNQHVARQSEMARVKMQVRGIHAHAGIIDLIKGLHTRGVRLALATQAERDNAELPLKQLGVYDYFDAIVGDQDVACSKPQPDVYIEAIRKLGVAVEHCAALEDAPHGVESAKRAGLRVIAVLTTHMREQLQQADCIIESAADIGADDVIKFISDL